jgi:hypothetical protein
MIYPLSVGRAHCWFTDETSSRWIFTAHFVSASVLWWLFLGEEAERLIFFLGMRNWTKRKAAQLVY